MPFKHNACRRHHIGKMKFKVTNWSEYEAGFRQRGSLTPWMTPEALSSWPAPKRTTPGGQLRYSDLAIETALRLGLVFDLRLRQTEGFLMSVLKLMRLLSGTAPVLRWLFRHVPMRWNGQPGIPPINETNISRPSTPMAG